MVDNLEILFTRESIDEINKLLTTSAYYIDMDNKPINSISTNMVELTLHNLLKE